MSTLLHVATRKGLFTYASTGVEWDVQRTSFIGDPVSAVLQDPRDETLYAALNLGHFGCKLRRSEDGGESWTECPVPAYEMVNGDAADGEASEGEGAPSLKLIWCLEAGGVDQPGRLWAGTIPGGLFVSDDRGDSWKLVQSLWERPERANWFGGGYDEPGIHSISVDPRDRDRLIVGVSCGGVWVSNDGGDNWECTTEGMYAEYMPPDRRDDPSIQDPHRLVHCPTMPDVLWVQHHNGVFRSTDGGRTWGEITAIEPSKFGFAVGVHPLEPMTAWFVPGVKDECRIPVDGSLAVARTRDGGQSFEVLRRGLPQHHAYDLVYRHALDVAADGDHLAIGSTTGNLWLTANQGDRWEALSSTLPPIYAVRFA